MAKKPAKSPAGYRRATKAELVALGVSAKSERYIPKSAKRVTAATKSISKRQYEKQRLGGVTLEARAKQYASGERFYRTMAQEAGVKKARETRTLRRSQGGLRLDTKTWAKYLKGYEKDAAASNLLSKWSERGKPEQSKFKMTRAARDELGASLALRASGQEIETGKFWNMINFMHSRNPNDPMIQLFLKSPKRENVEETEDA